MSIITVFIGVAILLGVGTQILGSVSLECDDLSDAGYNWTAGCVDVENTAGSGYGLLIIVAIVLAAAGILFAVRLMQ